MINTNSIGTANLVGLSVEHNVTMSVKQSFGSGKIVSVNGNKVSVDFGERVGVKTFLYPMCFLSHLSFTPGVESDILDMVDCDIELHLQAEDAKREELHRLAEITSIKPASCNFIALKRPYLDANFYCSKVQMKINVKSKCTNCLNSECQKCVLGSTTYESVIGNYSSGGGCPEYLIATNYIFKLSSRNRVAVGDVVLFTCIPTGCKEDDRMVYGFSVVTEVIDQKLYYDVKLDPDKTYFADFETATGYKFWNVMVNSKNPDVMLFGNSHLKRLTDMQMAQFIRMICGDSDDSEVISRYKDILAYIGISETEIVENNGALIQLEPAENTDEEVEWEAEEEKIDKKLKKRPSYKDEDDDEEDYYEEDDTDEVE